MISTILIGYSNYVFISLVAEYWQRFVKATNLILYEKLQVSWKLLIFNYVKKNRMPGLCDGS